MADSIVQGLFGVDPAQYQQEQLMAQAKQNMAVANMDPLAAGKYTMMQGASQLGNIGQQLMGVQDPMLQKATSLKAIASKFDYTTPDGLAQMAQALMQGGHPEQAQLAINRANELRKASIEQGLNTRKALAEGTSTEWIGVPGHPELKQQAIVDRISGKTTPVGEPISVYSSKQLITVDAKGETEFSKQLGKNDANTVTAAMTTRQNAVSTVKSLDKLAALDDKQLISGSFADGRVGAVNLLTTLGLASAGDAAALANSQQYNKVAKDTIFQTLGGKLGAGFSNEDRKFVEALIPQLDTDPVARRKLINYMRSKNLDIIGETTKLENYARKNRGLTGFEYTLPKESIAPVTDLSQGNPYEAEARSRGLIK